MDKLINTSLEAFRGLSPQKLSNARAMVYDVIKGCDGLCDKEIANRLGIPINRETPRRLELQDLGMVTLKGYKVFGGRRVKTWKVTK